MGNKRDKEKQQPCVHCAKLFNPWKKQAPTKFCSRQCYHLGVNGKPEDRFYKLVGKKNHNGCMLWQGNFIPLGYGSFQLNGKTQRAHRVAYAWAHQLKMPFRKFVLHSCDVSACVNPEHLFLGSQLDNIRDMHKKKRGVVGEKSIHAKLNKEKVLEIRKKSKEGAPLKNLALEYNMSMGAISLIKNGITWRHLL